MSEYKERRKFYQKHLSQVSRSFAFCIEELEEPLQHWISLAYILCRIVDTVEDSKWPSREEQSVAFKQLMSFLNAPVVEANAVQANTYDTWVARFPKEIPAGEIDLIRASERFFADFHQLEVGAKEVLKKSISEMALGMDYFCENKTIDGELQIKTLKETNQYCFFVAGLVGELLTGLASKAFSGIDHSKDNLLNAFHFGLYLQKINLLKDQLTDESEGRYFVTSRSDLKDSMIRNSRYALDYILRLPVEAKTYRIFCAWSFFLGLASLPWIEKAWEKKQKIKISRTQTWLLLGEIKKNISDNNFLLNKYREMVPQEEQPDWYHGIYGGPLTSSDFEHLGMT